MTDAPLLLVGCGRMGGALLRGWLDDGYDPSALAVIEPNRAASEIFAEVAYFDSPSDLSAKFAPAIVVFAVKPQMMDQVVPAYSRFAGGQTLFLSVAAGTTIDFFESQLGAGTTIVRTIPNTPAAVGRGITAAVANRHVDAAQREIATNLLSAVGDVVWLTDEDQMDAVTAVSGSGPAYVFLLAECLAEAGVAAGLPAEISARQARATVSGAGELLHHSDEDAAVLRQNVTSPGGTTEAALRVLMGSPGLAELLRQAVIAARDRGRELGK